MRVAKDVVLITGVVVGMDVGSDECEESYFMRVRVGINVTKPLCQKIMLWSGEENWVSFKYEQLPSVCYWCGLITHHDKDCLDGLRRKGAAKIADQQFGSWLRENTPNLVKKLVDRVTGYEDETEGEAATCWCPDRDEMDEGNK